MKNQGYAVSLELRKLYVAVPDTQAAKHKQLRVIDESGEDYLYPADRFAVVDLPNIVRSRLPRWQPSHRNKTLPAARQEQTPAERLIITC